MPGCPATGLDVDGGRVNRLPHKWLFGWIFKTFLLFPHLAKLPLCLSLFLYTFNMHYLTLSLFLLSSFLYFPPLSLFPSTLSARLQGTPILRQICYLLFPPTFISLFLIFFFSSFLKSISLFVQTYLTPYFLSFSHFLSFFYVPSLSTSLFLFSFSRIMHLLKRAMMCVLLVSSILSRYANFTALCYVKFRPG